MEKNKMKIVSKLLVIFIAVVVLASLPMSTYATSRAMELTPKEIDGFTIEQEEGKALYDPVTTWFYGYKNVPPRHYDGTHMTFECEIYSANNQTYSVKIYFTVVALNTTFYVTLGSNGNTYRLPPMPLGSLGGSQVGIEYESLDTSTVMIGVDNWTYSWYQ